MNELAAGQAVRPRSTAPAWKLVAVFYFIACGFSWLVWLPLVLGPDGLKVLRTPVSLPIFVCIGTLGPLLACFITHRWDTGNWHAIHFLPRGAFQWAWLLLGPSIIVFSRLFVFSALLTAGGPAEWRWHVRALTGIVVPMFNYNLFGGPLFEEFGWRGFLQSRLQRSLPPWIAGIFTGALWAVWHLPLFLVGWGGVSFPLFVLILASVALIMAFAFNASGQVIFVAILMHSALNAANFVLPGFLGNVPIREHPSQGLLLALSSVLVAVILAACTRGRLLYPRVQRGQ